MAILMEIDFPGVTAEQYDQADKRAGTRAAQAPDGLLFHSAIVTGAGLHVVDLWESREKLDAFMGRMMPVTKELGFADPKAPPEVTEVHHHFERR
ncbi:hypothetical protein DN069_06520 [Streptacidiphilus pinicola]|uniref:ABM domain-containing protein n=1 Tax=Streptacidiphilus pinicola TaxID=2219663 RepID=A0A2X0KI78_9ACTN|nr:hypothetical protein [Streptacidiphilus pinicola]RAG86460.1 hypothetical protein DN069_06520 [Streptacidiphilus pinicola]